MGHYFEDIPEKAQEIFSEVMGTDVSELVVTLKPIHVDDTAELQAYTGMGSKVFTKIAHDRISNQLIENGYTKSWTTDWMSNSHLYYTRLQLDKLFVHIFFQNVPSKSERIDLLKKELEELENESKII